MALPGFDGGLCRLLGEERDSHDRTNPTNRASQENIPAEHPSARRNDFAVRPLRSALDGPCDGEYLPRGQIELEEQPSHSLVTEFPQCFHCVSSRQIDDTVAVTVFRAGDAKSSRAQLADVLRKTRLKVRLPAEGSQLCTQSEDGLDGQTVDGLLLAVVEVVVGRFDVVAGYKTSEE